MRAMAARAVEMAIRAVPFPPDALVEVLRPELVVRESTGPISSAQHEADR
jgi:DNA-binding LacI/PurR family transcriptional regulator